MLSGSEEAATLLRDIIPFKKKKKKEGKIDWFFLIWPRRQR
jgi:hypothetical protein